VLKRKECGSAFAVQTNASCASMGGCGGVSCRHDAPPTTDPTLVPVWQMELPLPGRGLYQHINGTSAAAPQVAALAVRLYEVYPGATWNGKQGTLSVFNRIVTTRRTELDQHEAKQMRGPINLNAALQGWP
jgi:Subtilase family